jgi:hypothetical protein
MAKKPLKNQINGFESEEELGRAFKASAAIKRKMLYRDWRSWEARELQGLFGVPDHLLVLWKTCGRGRRLVRIVSFEIKREKWKRALIQAYRYSAFSDYSFVVMDHSYVHRALGAIEEFKRANIGLLSVAKKGRVHWHFIPVLRKPYSESAKHFLRDAIRRHLFGKPTRRKREGPTIKWSVL